MKTTTTLFLSFLFAILGYGCKKEATTYDCTSVVPTYNTDIAPIMNASCAVSGCHTSNSNAGGINLSGYAATKSASMGGNFLPSIQHSGSADRMPKGGSKLSDDKIKLIYCWIENGRLE
jgi:hypothetical protein